MQGQMDLFNPPDMHIVNVCGELREAPSWMHYKRCENCSAWEMLENNKQPPEGCGIYGWCKETIQRSQATSYSNLRGARNQNPYESSDNT